jgi:hypothetical protein
MPLLVLFSLNILTIYRNYGKINDADKKDIKSKVDYGILRGTNSDIIRV